MVKPPHFKENKAFARVARNIPLYYILFLVTFQVLFTIFDVYFVNFFGKLSIKRGQKEKKK